MDDYKYLQTLESDYEVSASSNPINLKLIFSDEVVHSPVFTKQKITGRRGGNEPIKVILVDADTQQEVTTGPVASAKVKMVLLRENYDGNTGEFEKNMVLSWGKKKNALVGDGLDVYLKHGRGTVGEIRIQHDSNPIKNVEFRLGAMVVDCPYKVKEAITQPFKVKDRRNAPKSFRPLSPTDKVWQLKNIGRHGKIHKRLESFNVYTVKDFLNMYDCNREKLQEIYRVKGKNWDTTLQHAQTCDEGSSNDNCYHPQPYEHDCNGLQMIVDDNFSIHDMDIDVDEEYYDTHVCFHDEGSLPCEASEEDGIYDAGSSTMVKHLGERKGLKAKKRWMKMRTLLLLMVSFMGGRANATGLGNLIRC